MIEKLKRKSDKKLVKAKSKEKLKRRVTREMSTFGLGSIFGTENSPTYSYGVYNYYIFNIYILYSIFIRSIPKNTFHYFLN